MDLEALAALHASLMRNIMQLGEALAERDARIAELEQMVATANGKAGARTNAKV